MGRIGQFPSILADARRGSKKPGPVERPGGRQGNLQRKWPISSPAMKDRGSDRRTIIDQTSRTAGWIKTSRTGPVCRFAGNIVGGSMLISGNTVPAAAFTGGCSAAACAGKLETGGT